ncbi:glutaredoxin family protein [sulfur-oxidizing endosymbiont of Gigantopelta aegis]|uniref:glutaredoxin family protein n=1 Tax=sulfur-oxidizing endosymbiont of Gigantopelta aegis TaxID=2794934 RepID=UPI0018DBD6F5|nr:glutaredoxin family protein [sulfur-oxidizing endosymbiont of Gigantopelta aegis]
MHFKFFYRIGCHLCDDMYLLLQPYESSHNISIEMINVDKDPELQKRYGILIPVLCDAEENEICHYFFDKIAFEQALSE